MGLQAMIKGALAPVKTNNTTNARSMKELDRRVTDIAADLERSDDPVKKEKLQRIVKTIAEGFTIPPEADGFSERLEPMKFVQRQALILNADKELNELQAPAPGREEKMTSATMKDYKNLEREIKRLSEPAIATLSRINELLPNTKTMQDPEACKHIERIIAEQSGINELQKAMAQFSHKIAQMEEKGFINQNILVTIFKVDDPDSDPEHHTIAGEKTFGELANDFLDNEEASLPDFWIRKVDPKQNCVTPTNAWWEFQDAEVKLGDAFSNVEGRDTRRIELIAREGDYVMALIHDNGMEKCHPVDLPRKRQFARDYLPCVFQGRKVRKILKLKDGTDVSQVMFDRRSFVARTNPVYVEMEDMAPKAASAHVGTV